ncbi:MAG: HesB/IscA family protein [Methanotrichaceae archaeon]
MIEVTDIAAEVLKRNMVEGKIIRMVLAATDVTGASYVLIWDDPAEDDSIFESNGIKIYMHPADAELLSETIIDYVTNGDLGKGFLIQGPPVKEVCAYNFQKNM